MPESTPLEQVNALLSDDAPGEESQGTDVEAVTDLLSGTDDDLGESPEGGDPSGDAETDVTDDPEGGSAVDYKQEIPMTDGTKVPLGELKDHYQQYQAKTAELITRENEVMAKRNEVNDLIGYVQNLPPELVQQIQGQQRAYLEREHSRMLEVLPEFRDPVQFKAAQAGIFALAQEYGVKDVIGQVTDHRIVKMLHDFARLKAGISKAKAEVRKVKTNDPKATKPAPTKGSDAAIAQAKKSGTKGDQIAAVSALLGG